MQGSLLCAGIFNQEKQLNAAVNKVFKLFGLIREMIKGDKKGITPIVATVLLISLVVVLGLIIFMWARSFFPESVQKSGMLIEESCGDVDLGIDYSNRIISVNNKANVPIYGVDVYKKSFGSVEEIASLTGPNYALKTGERKDFSISDEIELNTGDEILITPVLLGEEESGNRKAVSCGSDYSQSVII